MLDKLLSNPIFVVLGLMILVALLYFWNRKNSQRNRERRRRSFRENYYERKRKNKEQ